MHEDRRVQSKETFIARALRLFQRDVAANFARAKEWRRDAGAWVEQQLNHLYEWESKHKRGLIVGLAGAIFIALSVWFVVDWTRGRVAGNVVQTGLGGLVGGSILGFIASLLLALLLILVILLANKLFKLLVPAALFLPVILWIPLYAVVQAAIVTGKLLLLIPLALLFVTTRLFQLWRGIFYTCPSRDCAYRGLPFYECPQCGAGNPQLWPNLYGACWHYCEKCEKLLPALDVLGRKELAQRCGDCGVPLRGRHAGRARERLVAIVGGPGSGKTSYLLMTVNEMVRNTDALRGEIDEEPQAEEFARAWKNLAEGRPAIKTAEVLRAFLLYAQMGRTKFQLYLYDAPGEEYASIGAMTRQQYIPLLKGIILLADPLSFDAVHTRTNHSGARPISLQNVVASTLATTVAGLTPKRNGKLPLKVAVVIAKADLVAVQEQIGYVQRGPAESVQCRRALQQWGGENTLRAVEQHYEQVAYFACSSLGRDVDARSREAFQSYGVLEPLKWLLTKSGS